MTETGRSTGPGIRAVLLDMDGTIVDAFEPIERALNQTLREFGLPTMSPEEVRRHTGSGDASIERLFGDRLPEALDRFHEIHDRDYLDRCRPMPGADALLSWLSERGLSVGIVTSKTQHRAEAQLERLGWLTRVDVVVGKRDGMPGKPDPAPLLHACGRLQASPSACVMIGDGVSDMRAAAAAGSLPVGLTHAFSEAELRDAGAAFCFPDLHEVLEWLKTRIR